MRDLFLTVCLRIEHRVTCMLSFEIGFKVVRQTVQQFLETQAEQIGYDLEH